jgi:glyoxylase I family protein
VQDFTQNTPVKTSAIHHVALFANDVVRLAHFYVATFGLVETARHLKPDQSVRSIWLSFAQNSKVPFIAIEHEAKSAQSNDTGWAVVMLTIEHTDRISFLNNLKKQNITVERETSFSIFFRDPENNRVGVSHYPVPQQ